MEIIKRLQENRLEAATCVCSSIPSVTFSFLEDHCASKCHQHVVTPEPKHTSAPPLPTQDIHFHKQASVESP